MLIDNKLSNLIDKVVGIKKPKWVFVPEADEMLSGYFVKNVYGDLIPATPKIIEMGYILRDCVGSPILFNNKSEIVGHIQLDYPTFGTYPYAMWLKGKLLAYVVEE